MAIKSVTFIKVFFLFSVLWLSACDKAQTPASADPGLRWMDRTIYLANSISENRNNAFQKQRVKEALTDLETQTNLGEGYFSFTEVDEGALDVSLDSGVSDSQKSFILIWPDNVFDDYVVNVVNGQTPDPHAVAVLNSSNKRKFFIILRASCISAVANPTCPDIGVDGFKAMIFRQFGFLVGLSKKDCTLYPTDVMCADSPSRLQYSTSARLSFANSFNNRLESILLNPGYYP